MFNFAEQTKGERKCPKVLAGDKRAFHLGHPQDSVFSPAIRLSSLKSWLLLRIFLNPQSPFHSDVIFGDPKNNFSPSSINEKKLVRWHCVPKCSPPYTPIFFPLPHSLLTIDFLPNCERSNRMPALPQRPKTNPVINIDKTIAGRTPM